VPGRFTLENWENMNNSERIALCQTMARTAMRLADATPFNVSEALLSLAETWSRLATEITRSSLEPPTPEPVPG